MGAPCGISGMNWFEVGLAWFVGGFAWVSEPTNMFSNHLLIYQSFLQVRNIRKIRRNIPQPVILPGW